MENSVPVPKHFVKQLATCCMLLDKLQMQGTVITGVVDNQEDYDKVTELLIELNTLDQDLDPLFSQTDFEVKFEKTRQIFNGFDRLLNVADYRRNLPCDYFYFIKDKQAFYLDERNSYFQNYVKITELYKFFFSKADYVDSGNLIFLGNAKIVITDEYTEEDLISLPDFESFRIKFLNDSDNNSNVSVKEKDKLLKKALVSFFNNVETIKLSEIINDFHKFHVFVNDELDIYMSKFSYEEVKDQVERDKVDFIVRLNKVFSDIQTQLIGVPVSVILAADKLKIGEDAINDANKIFGFSISNLLVIGAIGFYAIVISMLMRNQQNSLAALHEEISFHKERFESKHKGLAKKFVRSFQQLDSRYEHQKKMLKWIDILVTLAFSVIILIFVKSSSEVYQKVYLVMFISSVILFVLIRLKKNRNF